MARLRMFGPAREAAGTGTAEVRAGSVAEVLGWASARYGPPFAAVLPTCAVWVNGEPADGDRVLEDGDEVAVLPPVSGG